MIPKPEPHRLVKRSERRKKQVSRGELRRRVLLRDAYRCRVCDVPVSVSGAHVHEIVFRSQGGSPFDDENCVVLCGVCHAEVHSHRLELLTGVDGANGQVVVVRHSARKPIPPGRV